MRDTILNSAYLVAAVLFILGLKRLSRPRTAVKGNLFGASGMFIAAVVTAFHQSVLTYEVIIAGIVIGGAVGAFMALKVQMTAMPQMVGLLNGFGGIASALVAGAALIEEVDLRPDLSPEFLVATAASALIGS